MNDEPTKKYADVPTHVRAFLEDLTEEEVDQLQSSIRWMRNALIVLGFVKWLIGAGIIAFTTMATVGESIIKIGKSWK